MHELTEWLSGLAGPAVYAVVAMLVFCEDALLVGVVLPGETAVLLGGVLASQGHVSVWPLAAVVVVAAVAGDSAGYTIGYRLGPRLLDSRTLRRHPDRVASAKALVRRRGAAAVFVGRFVAFFRALVPTLAGVTRLPYHTFLLFNALGGLIWGVGFTLLGYVAGNAYTRVEHTAGRIGILVVVVLALAALVVWRVRRRRTARTGNGEPEE